MATVLMASAAQEDVDEQRTIRNDAAIVRKLFLDNLSCYRENNADGHVIKSQIQDEFGRFNTWTANNHVFSPVLASLDTRFLHTPSFTEQLLTQLEALQSRLEECRSWSQSKFFAQAYSHRHYCPPGKKNS